MLRAGCLSLFRASCALNYLGYIFDIIVGELIERSRVAVDELIEVLGWASIEAVLRLSAQGVVGPKHHGRQVNGYRQSVGAP